ncbi:MAG: polysaccharide deacetylase family protein [Bacteroidota bacterium]|nr:polysaccharide deacetylase family protein [Bacteroidota bacterium]
MILIYSALLSNRLKYVLNEVFVNQLGITFKHTDSLDYFEKSNSIKLNYSTAIIDGCLNIPANNLLYEEDIFDQQIIVEKDTEWKYLFFQQIFENIPDFRLPTHYLNFDLFSAVFYLLSRYEEYLPSVKDEHQRYKETNSLAFKNGFLEIPLIDFWIMKFKNILKKQYPEIELKSTRFKQINTIDIDFIYKYKGHSTLRLAQKAAGALYRMKWDQRIFDKTKPDPYDSYDYLTEQANAKNIETIFFFLLADYGTYDKNHAPQSGLFANLVKSLCNNYTCGIHPSYRSTIDNKALRKELEIFEQLTSRRARDSRNHFLKIKIPETYLQLSKAGIEKDFTMAYSNHTGFRASASFPFQFFDLSANEQTPLWVQPVCLMDVTLKNAMKMDPATAIKKIAELKSIVKEVGGMFVSIWHNSSFDENEGWAGWDRVYNSLFEPS